MTKPHGIADSSASVIYVDQPGLNPDDVASIATARASTFARDTSAVGICVADGMGVRIVVERGALVIHDGMGPHRRSRRFDKATHGLRRVVVIGSTGLITLDALNWCRRLGIGILVLAPDGTASLSSTPRMTDDARMRCIQAHAPDLAVGLDLARSLIADKLVGQAKVLTHYFDAHDEASTIADLVDALSSAETFDEVRGRSRRSRGVLAGMGGSLAVHPALRFEGPGAHSDSLDPLRGPALGAGVGQRQP